MSILKRAAPVGAALGKAFIQTALLIAVKRELAAAMLCLRALCSPPPAAVRLSRSKVIP
jgi:hypothetical protein